VMRPDPEDELRLIQLCIVAPDERQPGRTYERVQEILHELYILRQRLAATTNGQPGNYRREP
jgi:hypothetical protein